MLPYVEKMVRCLSPKEGLNVDGLTEAGRWSCSRPSWRKEHLWKVFQVVLLWWLCGLLSVLVNCVLGLLQPILPCDAVGFLDIYLYIAVHICLFMMSLFLFLNTKMSIDKTSHFSSSEMVKHWKTHEDHPSLLIILILIVFRTSL